MTPLEDADAMLHLPPDALALRDEFRGWLEQHLVGEFARWRDRGGPGREDVPMDVLLAWERELAAGGWVGIGIPERDGGRGAGLLAQVAFHEEYARSGAPGRLPTIGESLLAPTLVAHGSDELRARFLPGVLAARELWCQGYSEPDAGSDLAAIKTTGRIVGDEWRITGQKIWTTWAQMADWCFVLARTEPESRGHRGLSFLLVPMDQPGIEVRPIIQLSGGEEFCEIFFSDARTEPTLVVGSEGDGWNVAMSTLGYERGSGSLGMQLAFERDLDAIIVLARENGTAADPVVRDRIARAWVGLRVLRASVVRTLVGSQRDATVTGSIGKLAWSTWFRDVGELWMLVRGAHALVRDPAEAPTTWPCSTGYDPDRAQRAFMFGRAVTIYAGSSEIQRTIIGEQVLGLPREPRA
jgi:alkylation response protein AidB-like acyl-CoA dehydrogenase